ncbi:hypothetical protein N7G274_006521 [Stereocaulon virgatum]|uniref:Uncharacterized protein n=1 Tax=Stereocaulon virgatum TaxID=373712 RepID=A0ABR4A3Q0_9LECA
MIESMRFFLAVCALLPCIPSASTLALNLTSIAHSLLSHFGSSYTLVNWYPTCVNGAQHPPWTGILYSSACTNALGKLKLVAAPFGVREFVFFSSEYVKDPPEGAWSLPVGLSYGEHSKHDSSNTLRRKYRLK